MEDVPILGLEALLAVEYLEVDDGHCRARLPVTEHVLQPYGIVHGGAYSTLAESIASRATDRVVSGNGMMAMGQSLSTMFLRPITAGHLNATATARHRGRTTWVWDVEISDDDGRPCALVRIIVAVRPHPDR